MGKRIEYQHGDIITGTRLIFQEDLSSLGKRRQARFMCFCGAVVDRDLHWVRFLNITSCGCYKTEQLVVKNTKHSHATRKVKSGAYRSWQAMHQRVKVDPYYVGVVICDRWDSFEAFYADMGDRPARYTIERKDGSLGYTPDNCVWASWLTQAQNTKNTVLVTIAGQTHSINEWCRINNIGYHVIKQRRARGMSLEDAIKTPLDQSKRGNKHHE